MKAQNPPPDNACLPLFSSPESAPTLLLCWHLLWLVVSEVVCFVPIYYSDISFKSLFIVPQLILVASVLAFLCVSHRPIAKRLLFGIVSFGVIAGFAEFVILLTNSACKFINTPCNDLETKSNVIGDLFYLAFILCVIIFRVVTLVDIFLRMKFNSSDYTKWVSASMDLVWEGKHKQQPIVHGAQLFIELGLLYLLHDDKVATWGIISGIIGAFLGILKASVPSVTSNLIALIVSAYEVGLTLSCSTSSLLVGAALVSFFARGASVVQVLTAVGSQMYSWIRAQLRNSQESSFPIALLVCY